MADTFAPVLMGLTFPFVVVSDGAASFTFGASATDQGDGVARVQLTLDHPLMSGGGAISTITFNSWGGAAGSSVVLPIDAGTIAGTYVVTQAIVTDAANNSTSYTTSGLQAVGIASSFVVQSNNPTDTTGPTLTGLAPSYYTPPHGTSPSVLLVATATDAGSGVRTVTVHLDHPIQTATDAIDTLVLNEANGFISGFGSDAAPGVYRFTEVDVTDRAGNVTKYDMATLADYAATHPAVTTSFTVADTTAPVLTSITLPPTIDASHGNTAVTFSAVAHDNVGIKSIELEFASALDVITYYDWVLHAGIQPVRASLTTLGLVDPHGFYPYPATTYSVTGDQYSMTAQVTPYTRGATETLVRATVTDISGNQTVYQGDQLAALGATSFTVKGDDAAPAITSIDAADVIIAPDQPLGFAIAVATSDPGTGLATVTATFDRPVTSSAPAYGGTPSNTVTWYNYSTVDDPNRIASVGSATPVQPGVYHLTGLTLIDYAGNSASYSGDQLKALGFDTDLAVGHPRQGDFGGDGHSDVLWLNRNGAVSTWSASPTGGLIQSTYNASVDPSWHAVETFDWNGDFRADILWRNDNGAVAIWNGAADGIAQASYGDQVDPNWRIAATGTYSGDARDDILWQYSDGSLSTWLSTGSGFTKNVWSHAAVGGGWKVEGTADFDGNGADDILWFNPTAGQVTFWNWGYNIDARGDGFPGFVEHGVLASGVGSGWHVSGLGDFNGDGKDDLLWRHDNGSVSVWTSTGSGFNQSQFNAYAAPGWSVAEVGDFNGDALADLLWRHANGTISIWQSTGAGWAQNTYSDGSVGNDWTIAGHSFPL